VLAIRLQRTGRKGHAQFRVIVQDSRRSPSSGRVVENLGNYNPHTKEVNIDKEKAATFLSNGAQPSERVARILKADGVKLPSWVKIVDSAQKKIKNSEKLRKNRPAEEVVAEVEETTTAENETTEVSEEAAATNDDTSNTTEEETKAEDSAAK
jgi:small subunit ribosomal protein S16